jgi:peroxidase
LKRGGPRWEVWLGRKDSLESSFRGANLFIPAPNSSLEALINNFKQQGLDIEDLVVLSGIFTSNYYIFLDNVSYNS